MTRNERIGASLFVMLASGGGLIYSLVKFAQPKKIVNLALDPYTLPAAVFALMCLLSFLGFVVALRLPKKDEKGTLLKVPVKTLLTALFVSLYVYFLKPVGFVITSFVFLWAQMFILQDGKKNWTLMTILSVVFSLGVYLLFTRAFAVMLPRGVLAFI